MNEEDPVSKPYLLWAGIRGPLTQCEGPEGKEACAQMRDGHAIRILNVDLVAVSTDEDLSYGYVVDVFREPPLLKMDRGTSHFPIQRAKQALAALGITGIVELRCQEGIVIQAEAH